MTMYRLVFLVLAFPAATTAWVSPDTFHGEKGLSQTRLEVKSHNTKAKFTDHLDLMKITCFALESCPKAALIRAKAIAAVRF